MTGTYWFYVYIVVAIITDSGIRLVLQHLKMKWKFCTMHYMLHCYSAHTTIDKIFLWMVPLCHYNLIYCKHNSLQCWCLFSGFVRHFWWKNCWVLSSHRLFYVSACATKLQTSLTSTTSLPLMSLVSEMFVHLLRWTSRNMEIHRYSGVLVSP